MKKSSALKVVVVARTRIKLRKTSETFFLPDISTLLRCALTGSLVKMMVKSAKTQILEKYCENREIVFGTS